MIKLKRKEEIVSWDLQESGSRSYKLSLSKRNESESVVTLPCCTLAGPFRQFVQSRRIGPASGMAHNRRHAVVAMAFFAFSRWKVYFLFPPPLQVILFRARHVAVPFAHDCLLRFPVCPGRSKKPELSHPVRSSPRHLRVPKENWAPACSRRPSYSHQGWQPPLQVNFTYFSNGLACQPTGFLC